MDENGALDVPSLDSCEIKGRGTVYIVQIPAGHPFHGKPRDLKGERVTIDGHDFTVRGVETFAVPDGSRTLEGPCGLLVGPHPPPR